MTTLETTMKRCDLCKEPLPLEAFAPRRGPGGRKGTCLGCEKKIAASSIPDDGHSLPEGSALPEKQAAYRGVRGGMLLAGYVK